MGEIVAYARVSSTDQNLDAQLQQLQAAGATKIFKEQVSGIKRDRPELAAMLDYVRKGDTVVITKLDRLGRSTAHLFQLVEQLKERGVEFRALNSNFDTSTPDGKLILGMLAVIAEFERDMLRERQAEGIAAAKERGVYTGRKPTAQAKASEVLAMAAQDMKRQDIADALGIGISSVYRILAENKTPPTQD